MTSVCMSRCATDARVPMRATYINLYKWPESDAEFVQSVANGGGGGARVVDSISCRQIYLRSYTFSRKESVPEKTKKCLGRVRDRVLRDHCNVVDDQHYRGSTKKKKRNNNNVKGCCGSRRSSSRGKDDEGGGRGGRKCRVVKKVKEMSCAALVSIFNKLLSCGASLEVVDQRG
ncbi:hypothetical protein Sjap_001684 [Stephania japonica]|uniref:Uncharacterized protein n=1 Tax=Stephania japonica TaxID=461633 RepID=A0AAP0KM61_9MAGN